MYKIVHVMSKVCQLVFAYVFVGAYPMDCNLLCESFYFFSKSVLNLFINGCE